MATCRAFYAGWLLIESTNMGVDLLVFANQYEALAPMLVEDTAVLLRGDLRVDESGPPKVSVSDIVPLDVARVALPKQISITIRLGNGNGTDTADRLRELFLSKPGNTDVRLRLIRSKEDRGVVVIFDKRVISKRYGKLFLDSLPDVTVKRGTLSSLPHEAQKWLELEP